MPRQTKSQTDSKTPALEKKEAAGAAALHTYLRATQGRQAAISRASGIPAPSLSRMSNRRAPISLEAAIALTVATDGELKADVLCPSQRELLAHFVALTVGAPA